MENKFKSLIVISCFATILASSVYIHQDTTVTTKEGQKAVYFNHLDKGQHITIDGFAASISHLIHGKNKFHIDSELANEMLRILAPNNFKSPFIWNLIINTNDESLANELGYLPEEDSFSIEMETSNYKNMLKVFEELNENKLKKITISPNQVEAFIKENKEFDINDQTVVYWAAELLQALNDLMFSFNKNQKYVQTNLQGLKVLESRYGLDSVQYKIAKWKTINSLNSIKNEIKKNIKGDFVSIYIKFSKSVKDNVVKRRRKLNQNEDDESDSDNVVKSDVAKFSEHASGYGMFLFILFGVIFGVYTMANMSFAQDTLLYSSVKID